MDELIDAFSNLSAVTVLSVAGGLALIFVCLVAYDSIRRKRRRTRLTGRSGLRAPSVNPIKSLCSFYQTLDEELTRRSRNQQRDRHRRK